MSSPKPRVLILAEQCNPEWPSLPVVGYKYAVALTNEVDAVVVTQIRNKPSLEKHGVGRADVIYLDTEWVAAPMFKLAKLLRRDSQKSWTIQMAMDLPAYLAFEAMAFHRLRGDLKQGRFDLIHRITPMSPTLPSVMPHLTKVPFVIGPLNGNLQWPAQFMAEQERERERLSVVRSAYKLLPFSRSTYAKSKAILAAFSHTLADLPADSQDRSFDFPEVGFDPELFTSAPRPQRKRKTILYVGRLVPYKLPEVVVRAFAAGKLLRSHRLLIVGEGPEAPRLRDLIREHQLEDCVEMVGKKTQAEVGELMRESEILAFPSIRELGAGAVVEAMASGMLCVVVDYGGPGTLIDSDRGIKIPMADRDSLVASYAKTLDELVADEDRVARLGLAARQYVLARYAWQAKARKTRAIYDWVLGRTGTRPDFYRDP